MVPCVYMITSSPEEMSAHTDHGVLGLLETDVTLETLVIVVFMVLVGS